MTDCDEKTILLVVPELGVEYDSNKDKIKFNDYLGESKKLLRIALPMMLTNLFAFLILSETVIICGQLGKYEMDGASLANSFVNVLGVALAVGFCTACDTFFSQILGSSHKKYLGVMLQRSLLIAITIPILLLPLHINWENILIALGQHPLVAKNCNEFLCLFSPGFIFIFLSLILNRYLQNQYYVMVPMISAIIANTFNITFQYLFVIYLGYGFHASPIIQFLTYALNFLIQLMYIIFTKLYKKHWTGITREAFLEWNRFIILAISGMALLFFDVFSWEICTFLSGVLGPTSLGAQTVLFHYETALFQACFALGVAVNIRVGEALGSNNWRRAIMTYRCGLILTLIYGAISCGILLSVSKYAAMLFTIEKDIQDLAVETFPFMLMALFFDFLSSINLGALRGCGRQRIGLLIVLFGYYVLGQPIGISLAFATPLRLKGIWIGLSISMAILTLVGFIFTNFIQDWKYQAESAQLRVKSNLRVKDDEEEEEGGGKLNIEYSLKHHKKSSSTSLIPSDNTYGKIKVRTIFVSESEYQKIYIKRALIYIFVLLMLIVGIIIKFTLPVSSNQISSFTTIAINNTLRYSTKSP